MNHIWHEKDGNAVLTIDGARLTVYFIATDRNDNETFGWSVAIGSITYKGSADSLEQGKQRAMRQFKEHLKTTTK